jgi:type I restriction enzyme S subunit
MSGNVPAIRFAGFTEPWEQRKFGDLYRPTSEKNDLTFGRDRIISVANMHFSTEVYVTDDDYLRTYNVMRLGDIAFEGHSNKEFAHGRFVENDLADGIVSHIFIVLRPRVPYDLKYWRYAINNERLMRDVLTRSTKASTMMHDLVIEDFLQERILVPSLQEQRAVGALFDCLDNLITLHQRKHDQLATLKKSLLDKMFPKPGSDVPELRFAGFTEPWEQRKFSELASLRRGLTYSPADIRPQGQGVRVLRSSNIDEETFALNDEDVFVDEDAVGIRPVQEGEILITAANGSPRLVGKRAVIRGLTGKTVHGGFMLCAHADQPDFVAALMGSNWYRRFLATGVAGGNGSIGNLDKVALESEIATVPSVEEQRQIGALFSCLDSLITLHQRKHDQLAMLKKSLLDKMFV